MPELTPSRPTLLVTGGGGYIGSHTVLELLPHFQVVVVDNLSRGHRDAVPADVPFLQLDVRDTHALTALLREHAVACVVHFAAYISVGESMREPGLYFENNVGGTLSLLQAMQAAGVSRIVFSSTAAVYGYPGDEPVRETQPIAPVNVYGETKAIAERLLHWFEVTAAIRHVALRYFNAAGADAAGRAGERHQPETHAIPLLLQAIRGDGPAFELFGDDYATPDGTCIRDYIHVSDLARAHLAAVRHLLAGRPSTAVNLGRGDGDSVRALIQAAERVTGRRAPVRVSPRRDGDPPVLVANPAKAQELLGWRAEQSRLDQILASAWAWMQASAS